MRIGFIKMFLIVLLFFSGCASLKVEERRASAVEENRSAESTVLAKSAKSWDGNLLPNYPSERPEISVLKINIPAGATLPMHKHPVINAGYMLEGELTVETESGAVLHLKAGDAIIEVVDTWHFGRNEGKVPVEIVVFYAGTASLPVTEYKNK